MGTRELNVLLICISQGDNAAFEKLYSQTRRGVYAFLYSYFHNAADTEDAMQTTYLYVKKGISTYRSGTNARAWLLQIAKNVALNDLKKKKREIPTENVEMGSYEYTGTITDVMEKVLSEEEQRIVTMHVLWKYKHREIGEILGCPTGTVTSKYKRAIEKLKKSLKEENL